jgi:4-alpha-glucanotransferase
MQNLPGTTVEHPNWVRKCDVPLERWGSSVRAARIAEAIRREGRGPATV